MPLVLRVDVDKPYGKSSFGRRVMSKLVEDYWFPRTTGLGYLRDLRLLLGVLERHDVGGHIYLRTCTAPDPATAELLRRGGHHVGFHAENTRSFETFANELACFRDRVGGLEVKSFTKHGSGTLKLGRHHYPPYEEEKYRDWAGRLGLGFPFGNGTISDFDSLSESLAFLPEMFWMEADYRDPAASDSSRLVALAERFFVPVLIHPSNYVALRQARTDFDALLDQAASAGVGWVVG